MNIKSSKKGLKITRDYVAGLAREYHNARLNVVIKLKDSELDFITLKVLKQHEDLCYSRYMSAKAVLESCSSVLQQTIDCLDVYRKGCDTLISKPLEK